MQAGEWALLVALSLLAFAGLYYLYWRYVASPSYVLLPTITSKLCKHNGEEEPHYLAYITAEEHKMLVKKKGLGLRKAGTQGVPCYPSTSNRRRTNRSSYPLRPLKVPQHRLRYQGAKKYEDENAISDLEWYYTSTKDDELDSDEDEELFWRKRILAGLPVDMSYQINR